MNAAPTPSVLLPPLTIVAGPARSGKTAWCIDRLLAAPRGSVLVVDAGGDRVRRRARGAGLACDPAKGPVLTSGRLIERLARPGRRPLTHAGATLQRIFLEEAVAEACDAAGPFGAVREARGFVQALRSIVREMKLACATPAGLLTAADATAQQLDDPAFAAKMRELAAIWAAYEGLLQRHGCRDDEDRVADAIASVAEGRAKPPAMLLIDGRRHIEPQWRQLLAALAGQGCQVALTLTDDPARPLLFAPTARMLADLSGEFDLTIERLERRQVPGLAAALAHLERALFGQDDQMPLPALPESPLAYFDAPSPYAEAEMIARELRERHDRHATPWHRCAVIVRSAAVQAPVVAAVLRERYAIPAVVRTQAPLTDHPLVQMLLALFDVFAHDWRGDDVFRYLKATYVPVGAVAAQLLQRKMRRSRRMDGRERWAALLDADPSADDEARRHIRAMLAWQSRLCDGAHTADDLQEALDELLKEHHRVPESDREAHHALKALKEVLGEIGVASKLHGEGPIAFDEWVGHVAALCSTARYHAGPGSASDDDVVEVMEPDEAHALEADWCAVMGMTERVFPKRVAEDPFIRDDERAALAEVGGPRLALRRDEADNERLRFYLAATTPTKRLVLSFPRATEEQDALPSFYLDDVRALYDHVPALVATLAEVVPPAEQAVTDREVMLAECAAARPDGAEASPGAAAILSARSIPPSPRIEDAERLSKAGRKRKYGMTELEDYLACPFQHFAKHALHLREDHDEAGPEERGSIYHRVIERTMRRLGEDPVALEPLRDALRQELQRHLAVECAGLPPRQARMIERALTEAVDRFAAREVRYRGIFGATPTYHELQFGQPDDASDREPASKLQPLVVAATDTSPAVEVSGTIDRVDLLPNGHALVMDYKLGHGVKFDEMQAGTSLQMPVYMLAIESLWGRAAAVACYDSGRDDCRPRVFRRSAVPDAEALRPIAGVEHGATVKPMNEEEHARLMQTAEDTVRRAAAGIRAQDIVPRPGKHCDICAYSDLCRTNSTGEHDGEELPVT